MAELPRGDALRRAREQAGLSQDELADRIDVSKRTVMRYENNEVDKPKGYVIREWLRATAERGAGEDAEDLELISDRPSPDALRNAGLVVRDAQSGRVWYYIPFPDWMVVVNPMVVRIEADADDTKADRVGNRK